MARRRRREKRVKPSDKVLRARQKTKQDYDKANRILLGLSNKGLSKEERKERKKANRRMEQGIKKISERRTH